MSAEIFFTIFDSVTNTIGTRNYFIDQFKINKIIFLEPFLKGLLEIIFFHRIWSKLIKKIVFVPERKEKDVLHIKEIKSNCSDNGSQT